MIITVLLTLVIISILFFLFYRIKTPYYRVDRARMINTLQMVLTGQATQNDWQITFGMTIRHSKALEKIRLQCVEIEEQWYIGHQRPPYLFSQVGLEELRVILDKLNAPI